MTTEAQTRVQLTCLKRLTPLCHPQLPINKVPELSAVLGVSLIGLGLLALRKGNRKTGM